MVEAFFKFKLHSLEARRNGMGTEPYIGGSESLLGGAPGSCIDSDSGKVILNRYDETPIVYLNTFGFTLSGPSSTPVDGVLVEIRARATHADRIRTNTLFLVRDAGGILEYGYDASPSSCYGTTCGFCASAGGSGADGSVWGLTGLSVGSVQRSDFGLAFACDNITKINADVTVWIDTIRVTVWWTDGSQQNEVKTAGVIGTLP